MTEGCDTASNRVVFFGTDSFFSLGVFRTLLDEGVNVVLAAVPGPAPASSSLPVVVQSRPETVVSLAEARHIPVRHALDFESDGTVAAVRQLAPDFLLVACFPVRLPPVLCDIPTEDALNLHPSLLPRYRGPAPLFWQLRFGERNTGVTLHRLSQRLDRGDIIAQERTSWPDGIRAPEIEERLAVRGARLFVESLPCYQRNEVKPRPQAESASSYFPSPAEEDFRLSSDWSARRLFNFMRGTETWGRSYPLRLGERECRLCKAIAHVADGYLGDGFETEGEEIRVQCSRGVLHATLEQRKGP